MRRNTITNAMHKDALLVLSAVQTDLCFLTKGSVAKCLLIKCAAKSVGKRTCSKKAINDFLIAGNNNFFVAEFFRQIPLAFQNQLNLFSFDKRIPFEIRALGIF